MLKCAFTGSSTSDTFSTRVMTALNRMEPVSFIVDDNYVVPGRIKLKCDYDKDVAEVLEQVTCENAFSPNFTALLYNLSGDYDATECHMLRSIGFYSFEVHSDDYIEVTLGFNRVLQNEYVDQRCKESAVYSWYFETLLQLKDKVDAIKEEDDAPQFCEVDKSSMPKHPIDEVIGRYDAKNTAMAFIAEKVPMPERKSVMMYFINIMHMIDLLEMYWNSINIDKTETGVNRIRISCNCINEDGDKMVVDIMETGWIETNFYTANDASIFNIEQHFMTDAAYFRNPPKTNKYDKYIAAYSMLFGKAIFKDRRYGDTKIQFYKPNGSWKYVTD